MQTLTRYDIGDRALHDLARYALVAELARGGGGQVAVAIDRQLGHRVAIKRALDRDGDARLAREAMVLALLDHPAIVPLLDVGVDADGVPYYAMQLVGGTDLAAHVAAAETLADRLALVDTIAIVADAVGYAHGERVIHRDLKPNNVLIGEHGEILVIDWGLAKLLDQDDPAMALTCPGSVLGTPAFMAPEQALGVDVDERTDVYALGAMLYHALSGAVPYDSLDGDLTLARLIAGPPLSLRDRAPDVPPALAAIVETAMARDPANRYATARDLAAALR